jgi:dTDP-4-amino-4,6-dideoxygalactose transaminase
LSSAFLWAQLEQANQITEKRLAAWQRYYDMLEPLESRGFIRRPIVPDGCVHNGHMFYVILTDGIDRQKVINELKRHRISSVFHYVPLHSSPAGRRYGRAHGTLEVTNRQSERLLRLPLFAGLTESKQDQVVDVLIQSISQQL